jgi:hypothetical protein
MNTRYDDAGTTGGRSNTLAAIFATEKSARDAIKNLHKAGFKQTWLGKTRENDPSTGQPTVEGGNDAFARFLSAGSDRRPLHRALIERGLTETQARDVEGDIAPGCLVVTVYAEDNPQRVAEILADDNGDVIDAPGETPRAVERASRDPRTGTDERNDDRNPAWQDRDRENVDADDTTNPRRLQTQRDDFLADENPRDDEGYVMEEFIATGGNRDAFR